MNQHIKLSAIALGVGAAAFAMASFSAFLVAVSDKGKLHELQASIASQQGELQVLVQQNSRLTQAVEELDIGLTAIVELQKLDRPQLAAAIEAERLRLKTARQQALDAAKAGGAVAGEQADAQVTGSVGEHTGNPFADLMREGGAATVDAQQPSAPATPLNIITPADPVTVAKVDGLLSRRIGENWVRPQGNIAGLKSTVQIRMSRSGNVLEAKLVKGSGNKSFDSSALDAIRGIARIEEMAMLTNEDFESSYQKRTILFSPEP